MRAIERVFAVLNCLSRASSGLTLQEIADHIRLPKSTTFRLMADLASMGYAARGEDLTYTLTPSFFRLTAGTASNTNTKQLLRPVLTDLVHITGENVALHCAQNNNRVCVDVARSSAPLVGMYRSGEKMPLGLGAASMVLMAYMPLTELRRVRREAAHAAGCGVAELNSILAVTKEQGYAVSHGGGVRGLTGISAPVFEPDGSVKYALAVVLPTSRVSGRVMELVAAVMKAAQEASKRLAGHPGPSSKYGTRSTAGTRAQKIRRKAGHTGLSSKAGSAAKRPDPLSSA